MRFAFEPASALSIWILNVDFAFLLWDQFDGLFTPSLVVNLLHGSLQKLRLQDFSLYATAVAIL